MDFAFTKEQERFRRELREFLERELASQLANIPVDQWIRGISRQFSRKVAEKGWIGLTWPREYGGKGLSYLDRLIYTEEMLRYGAPVALHWMAERQIGPSLIAYGTEEQRREFLPRIMNGEVMFCIGMSEPEAGTDLASLRTRAIEDGDDFVIEGQKVWTSGAHVADYCWLVVRTDPDVPKHKGISEIIVDLKLPGITIRPLEDLTGAHDLTEVFFDSVRVPKRYLVGTKNRGWYQIIAQLDYERSGIERLMSNYPLLHDLLAFVKEAKPSGGPSGDDPRVRQRLIQLRVEFEVGRLLCYRVAWLLSQEVIPNYEAAMAKAFCTEYEQRLANTATQVIGLYGQLVPGSKWVPLAGRAVANYLYSPCYTIQGGTSETLRNIVAQRGLKLPVG